MARLLEKREGELPEDFRDELERLKDKEAGHFAVMDLGIEWILLLVQYILMLARCHLRDFVEVRLITCIFFGERNSRLDSHQIVNKNIASFRIIQLCTQAFTTIPYNSNIVIERRQLQQQLLLLLIQNSSTPFLLGGIS